MIINTHLLSVKRGESIAVGRGNEERHFFDTSVPVVPSIIELCLSTSHYICTRRYHVSCKRILLAVKLQEVSFFIQFSFLVLTDSIESVNTLTLKRELFLPWLFRIPLIVKDDFPVVCEFSLARE